MLKLRKVELLGFKSFCEKTQITFSGTGLTCIVGPNGCGKSNIVDAISWVLGEQSQKSLRAERMADCIFNGTQKRPPMGMAEVSLTLVDPELAEAAAKVLGEAKQTEAAGEQEQAAGTEEGLSTDGAESTEEVTEGFHPAQAGAEQPAEGSRGRKRLASRDALRTKPGEIVIGRRLYRSGQSEYLVNGRLARLRDIQEIFMGTGLGPDTYAIIEQGRIGQILSSKPMDRRAIIEEAAGVTKYKTKRRLAEAKLESSKLNLARVNDILVEVEKQLGSLKRQASKARRFAEVREQMRSLQRQVLASKAAELDREAERLAGLLREIAADEAQQVQALAALEAEQERLNARSAELESELRQSRNLLGQTALELDRAEHRVHFNRERGGELELRSRQLADELAQARQQGAVLEDRVREHETRVAELARAEAQLEAVVGKLASQVLELSGTQQATEARIEQVRQQAGQRGEEVTRLHGEHAQAVENLSHHREAQGRAELLSQHLEKHAAQCRKQAEDSENIWQAAEAKARRLEQAVCEAQASIAELRRSQQDTAQRCERIREELSGARARRRTLEQILNDRAYTAEAVQKLFAANGQGKDQGFRAVGVLADYAEVEERYETAVEQFLREELEYVVVETFDHARAGIALLREQVGGRVTFFVDSLRNWRVSPEERPMPFSGDTGVVARMDQLVRLRDPLGAAAKQFLPKLESAFLVENSSVAERLASRHPKHQFVAPDGTCYHGRLVTGGRPGDAGPLAMKRELRAIQARELEIEREVQEMQAALRGLESELHNCQEQLAVLGEQQREAEKAVVVATLGRDQARAERERGERQLEECRQEIIRLRSEVEAARARAEQLRQRQAEAWKSRLDAEAEMAQAAERLAGLRKAAQNRQDELAARRAELAAQAERRASAEAIGQRLREELRNTREREQALATQQAALESERAALENGTAELERQWESLGAEKARLEQRQTQLEQDWDRARVRAVEVDDKLRVARQKLGELRELRSSREVEQARNESDLNHLRETCLAELHAHPADLIAQEANLLAGEELAAAETCCREMRAKIEAMGPVNMMALEEYQECEQRFTFLARERDDLVQSIEDTQQTIRELDEVSRQKFQLAFTAINQNFAEVFRALFGGGTGEMRLTEPDSTGDTGIDFAAQPPGKRLQNVLLLSGGEKALTALALLIAIFRYQPSPFCILDEVDAPLDEANVSRFGKLMAEMTEKTQFILVTHNRRTMEMAPVLYGVTMQEPGVSKLVSVRWDEPEARAA